MPRPLVVLATSAFLLAACGATSANPAPSTSAATALPTAPAATAVRTVVATEPSATVRPSTGVRPSFPPAAPMIARPYWLVFTGTSSWNTPTSGEVLQTNRGLTYQVLEGGGMDMTDTTDTIVITATGRGELTVYTTIGTEQFPGINPIEAQYGAQIDDILPDPSLPRASWTSDDPNAWTRSTEARGGHAVFVRTSNDPSAGPSDPRSEAYWWGDQAAGQWFGFSMQNKETGFEDVLTALLGPAE